MATSAAAFEDREVSIGRIFSRAFGTIGSNPVATFGIAFLLQALPALLINYGSQQLRVANIGKIGWTLPIVIGLATLALIIVFWTVTQGALVRATVAFSEGRKASFAESITAGLAVTIPLFLLGVLSGLGIGLGMILLLVPGIILYIMWSVAAPALVEERIGVFEAFGRSNDLTDGARWKIFGLELIAFVGYWIFSGVVGVIQVTIFGGLRGAAAATVQGFPLSYFVITAIATTVTTAVWGVIQTSLYVELRNWKDGPATDALADVFG
ncbi:MAG TPA: YciC family protein [Allosphingosinicella sp.]|nr:YciC family protein [Allosphingosinicella sp.]